MGRELLEPSCCTASAAAQLHPKGRFHQPRARLRVWTNKVGLERLPSISNRPLLVGVGMSHNLHHESVKLHLKQYKPLAFLTPP